MKVSAAVLHAPGEALSVETLDLAPPGPEEVLVRVRAAGVCRSDHHVMSGRAPHACPVVPGHEGAGEVVSVGEGVQSVTPGDHIILSWIPYCGICFFCMNGETHLCRAFAAPLKAGTMPDGSCRLSSCGRPVRHLSMLACWADHAVVPEKSCVPVRRDLPFEVAALLGCALTTGLGAVLNRAAIPRGSRVAIFGAGGVGLSAIIGAKLAGAESVIAIDQEPDKEPLARAMGATAFLRMGTDAAGQVRAHTDGVGADYVFEAVGDVGLQATCLESTRPGGTLVLIGMPGEHEVLPVPSTRLIRDEKVLTGSIFGSARIARDLARFADFCADGTIPAEALVARRYALEDINRACGDLFGAEAGRGVICFPHR